jgi:Methyltransferase FkbM domain
MMMMMMMMMMSNRGMQLGIVFLIGYLAGFIQHGNLSHISSATTREKSGDRVENETTTANNVLQQRQPPPNNNNNNNNDGWKSIDVFVGQKMTTSDMSIIPLSWKSQARQEEIVTGLLGAAIGGGGDDKKNKKRAYNGFFIDLAANHYMDMSNTYPLEQAPYEWKGLCIEANPKYWTNLTFYRDCQVVGAVVGKNRMQAVNFSFDLWGGVGGGIVGADYDNKEDNVHSRVQLYTVPLQEVFERHNVPAVIDYLSLDVEGAEHFIMDSFPYDNYRIQIMTVERPKSMFHTIVEAHGYVCLATISDFGETLWVHSDSVATLDLDSVRKHAKQLSHCRSGKTSPLLGI